jgi:hypothetical protein
MSKKIKFRPPRNIDAPSGFTNGQRAARAQETLEFHFRNDGQLDPETNLTDLLSDLMHLCHREGTNFEAQLANARANWIDEG